ncbi:hypothetical protein BCR34DRAFT_664029 [Clohesyomyces aquaticus]|uniref:Uncharacterized protein n=1 Tax=Clohesyomyces aquaticus TaxID=1231657 RepID=A0A1Y1ZPH3_9PLEO|nr:hypothetical protein BCR34DRAFT_664029 [Clohesyomyces aquaticus]
MKLSSVAALVTVLGTAVAAPLGNLESHDCGTADKDIPPYLTLKNACMHSCGRACDVLINICRQFYQYCETSNWPTEPIDAPGGLMKKRVDSDHGAGRVSLI